MVAEIHQALPSPLFDVKHIWLIYLWGKAKLEAAEWGLEMYIMILQHDITSTT